ncbi:MAG: cytochrome c biogenesis protein CcsA, partial [Balneolales bacterium]
LDLQNVYIWASFYSGQEGSFLLWILFSFFICLGILKWTDNTYRAPVMFFLLLSQVFLISMVAGIEIGSFTLGASPFRTLATEMPNAPIFQSDPDFVPADGSGLNDLLRSPWIVIHPPILFAGFAMMAVPFAFAFASLWKQKYNEWIYPALPWTLGANLCLLTAIFLGGYWAYVTLSFGGYWAWDPVENASLVPWIFGMAGIHAMLIQRTSSIAQKASILFAILAYMAVVYSTFLTRSGILGEASFHSFVDLGLYMQLLLFLVVTTVIGLGMFFWRYKELPSPDKEAPLISREFMMFSGSMILFLAGFVIMLGTSSPILGRLFVANPTPPAQEFYNSWMLPFGVIIAIASVIAQYLWWEKYNAETLSAAMIGPTFATSVVTIATIIFGNIANIAYMIYLFAGYFSIIGNGIILIRL